MGSFVFANEEYLKRNDPFDIFKDLEMTFESGKIRPNIFPGTMIPNWAWIIINLLNRNEINQRRKESIKRDFRVLLRNIKTLILWPVTIFGLPNQPRVKRNYTETLTERSIVENDTRHHELAGSNATNNLLQMVFYTFFGLVKFVLAATPVLSMIYWYLDKKSTEGSILKSQRKENKFQDQKEKWFFVNGIYTYQNGAKLAQTRLENLFGVPVDVLYNPTDGIFLDVIECIFGRSLHLWTNVTMRTYEQVYNALSDKDVKKVVLIGHSQGAILVSNILFILSNKNKNSSLLSNKESPVTDEMLRKLEVYTFASPANEMNDADGLIYCEHFVNAHDAVACIGIADREINYQTNNVFFNRHRRGHFLNQHYLCDFDLKPYSTKNQVNGQPVTPRLYKYLERI